MPFAHYRQARLVLAINSVLVIACGHTPECLPEQEEPDSPAHSSAVIRSWQSDTTTVVLINVVDYAGRPAAAYVKFARLGEPVDTVAAYADRDGRLEVTGVPSGDYGLTIDWFAAKTLVDTVSISPRSTVEISAVMAYERVALSPNPCDKCPGVVCF